ncbi:hypothetical protein C482_01535 [Natrialba chahannaoensis JCM 10990]|uniref:Uncharacterized protein n=1 Tax=Natrialba chahannaoensis JCM 10990 TaxID=1227492 RepID=M0B9Y0_9EURY|nr:hypothetical protein [Natrialba chahannaoensis]ELZ06459.1 hypothetical protein C482_01535 [Natrialba chahannaoensis JCM 10990]
MTSSDTAAETTTASPQPSLLGQLVVLAVFVLLGTSALIRSAGTVSPGSAVGLIAVLAGFGVVLLWRRAASTSAQDTRHAAQTQNTDAVDSNGPGSQTAANADADTDGDTETPATESDSSVWNAIPSWQYEGRHVESGGVARSEQEKALQDIQQQAVELSEEHEEN